MNAKFLYGVGCALLGLCVSEVGLEVLSQFVTRSLFGIQNDWVDPAANGIRSLAAFLVAVGVLIVARDFFFAPIFRWIDARVTNWQNRY